MKHYTLGPLPWTEDRLQKAYFGNFRAASQAIQEHPGFFSHSELESLNFGIAIFTDSLADLKRLIRSFHEHSGSPEFWDRSNRGAFKARTLSVQRALFTASSSAIAWMEQSEAVVKRLKRRHGRNFSPDYQNQKIALVDRGDHRFIRELRNFSSHVMVSEAKWEQKKTFGPTPSLTTRFVLSGPELSGVSSRDPAVRKFVESQHWKIDVEQLFANYKPAVESFHKWLMTDALHVAEPELSEYRNYETTLKRFSSRASWKLLIGQIAIPQKLDPYAHLSHYLTTEEIDEVNALPLRSFRQVDRIVELADEYGACDQELRALVYKLFQASG